MELTYEQERWLITNGGRTEKDIMMDDDGMFVLMYDPHAFGGMRRVFIGT